MRRRWAKRILLGLLGVLVLLLATASILAFPRLPALKFFVSLRAGPLPDGTRIREFELVEEPGRFGPRRFLVGRPDGVEARPTMLVVHGAAEKGIDDGRLLRLAVAFVDAGYTTILPEVHGLVRMENHDEDERRLRLLLRELASGSVPRADPSRIGIFGISVGAPLALWTAAAHVADGGTGLRGVCLLGSPDDIRRVAHRWFAVPPAPPGSDAAARDRADAAFFARNMVVRAGMARLVPEADHPRLRAWLEASPRPTVPPEGPLTGEGRGLADAVLRGAPEDEARRWIEAGWESLRLLSPAHFEDRLAALRDVPVWLVHGTADPLVEPAEMEALERRLASRGPVRTLLTPVVSHVGVSAEDAWPTVLFVDGFFDRVSE